jgi:hypothetical protein
LGSVNQRHCTSVVHLMSKLIGYGLSCFLMRDSFNHGLIHVLFQIVVDIANQMVVKALVPSRQITSPVNVKLLETCIDLHCDGTSWSLAEAT